jgi:hypothetical protein
MLTIPPAFKDNVLIFLSNKNVYPINHSEADKIEFAIIAKLVFPAHERKLMNLFIGHKRTLAPVLGNG